MKYTTLMTHAEPEQSEETPPTDEEMFSGLMLTNEYGWTPETLTYHGAATRSILLSGEVNRPLANVVCSQLRTLSTVCGESPITVVINSPGGDVVQALAMYDVMRAIPCPIITIVQGEASSAGFLLMQGGDLRFAFPNSRLFYHEPIIGLQASSEHEMNAAYGNYQWALATMNDIIRKRTNMKKSQWTKHFAGSTANFMTAKEALKLNILDDLLEYMEKPPLVIPVGD